jgi:outer membrane protein TolC
VSDLESQAIVSRRLLLALLGVGTDPLDSLPITDELRAPPAVPAGLPGELLERRPDVREARERLVAENADLKLNELAQLPTLTLQPEALISHAPSLLGGPVTLGTLGIGAGLTQPIFDLPNIRGQIAAQDARALQAAIAYEDSLQNAYAETENAMATLAADERRIDQLTRAEADARWALEAAQSQYAAGTSDLPSTLLAEQTWRAARLQRTGVQVEALRRSVQLFKALGGGWAAPPTAVAAN